MGGPYFLHGLEKRSSRNLFSSSSRQASSRRLARCNRHEVRAWVVAFISCCLVRRSTGGLGPLGETVSLPACTQQIVRRGAFASRLDPLAFSGEKRGCSKVLVYAVLYGTSNADPEPFSSDPENWALAKPLPSRPQKISARAAILPLLDWLPARAAHDFCFPEDPRLAW